VILGQNSYEQLTLVVCIIVKYDFPANWVALNNWLLFMFDNLYQNISSVSVDQIPKIKRFLGLYLQIMKEQNKKKLASSKG
jgi:hypothetical protein